ncbi:MAG: AhpC/TSA family protein [Bacteroidales bacterium]|nr:AhpC/TSA family protein [Bacteroidales bacterium]MCF8337791.1 AhpC/TSA family protein [Bacteroidales bacterium]
MYKQMTINIAKALYIFVILIFTTSCFTGSSVKKFGIDKEDGVPEGLQVNHKAPDFTGKTHKGENFRLSEKLSEGPLMLFFYRGFWCPVCNDYLQDYQDSLKMVTGKGVNVVAVTPETSENIDKTREKTGTSFPIISDSARQIMKKYNVDFKVTKGYQSMIKAGKFIDIATANDQQEAHLPVPATYLINPKGTIVWRQFDPDYKNRASIADIVEAIDEQGL